MPKTKISEFSATPGNNTDIDGINIAEGCAPSGINDAIRELMAQLKDFQAGTAGDSFNGPVGTSTAAAGAFTTLSSTGNTTLGDASGDAVTINGATTFVNVSPTITPGTANGVAYLNGSKVLTTGSALTFDGSLFTVKPANTEFVVGSTFAKVENKAGASANLILADTTDSATLRNIGSSLAFLTSSSEQARLTSTGLGIGTSSPAYKLQITNTAASAFASVVSVNTGTAGLLLGDTDSATVGRVEYDNAGNFMALYTNGSERLRLDSSGNLGVGSTVINGFYGSTSVAARGVYVYTSSSTNCDTAPKGLVIRNDDTTAGNLSQLVFGSLNTGNTPIASASIWSINDARSSGFSTGSLAFGTVGGSGVISERARIDSSGNLLVGGTTSYGRLTTYGNLVSVGDGPDAGVSLRSTSGRDSYGIFNINESGTASALGFYWIDGSGNPSTGTERCRITSGGDVGIGTSSPSERLDVYLNSTGNISAKVGNTSGSIQLLQSNAIAYVYTAANQPIAFSTNNTERARITSGGDFVSGSSTPGAYVNTNSFWFSGANGYGGWSHVNGTASGAEYLFFSYNASVIGSITQNGTTAVAYNTSSDYRLKENIQPMTGALAKVQALKPCTYKWKADGSDGEGFIAHELAEVVPQCVTGEKDAVDEDGNPKYQGIDTSFLVATLTAAIQELKAEFDAYKATHP